MDACECTTHDSTYLVLHTHVYIFIEIGRENEKYMERSILIYPYTCDFVYLDGICIHILHAYTYMYIYVVRESEVEETGMCIYIEREGYIYTHVGLVLAMADGPWPMA